MAIPILKPQRKDNNALGKAISIGQVVGGIVSGNPAPIVNGATSLAGQVKAGEAGVDSGIPTSPMERRLGQANQASQLAQLEQGIQTLPQMPPEQRAQYEPQLLDAYSYLKSQNKGFA